MALSVAGPPEGLPLSVFPPSALYNSASFHALGYSLRKTGTSFLQGHRVSPTCCSVRAGSRLRSPPPRRPRARRLRAPPAEQPGRQRRHLRGRAQPGPAGAERGQQRGQRVPGPRATPHGASVQLVAQRLQPQRGHLRRRPAQPGASVAATAHGRGPAAAMPGTRAHGVRRSLPGPQVSPFTARLLC